MKIREGANLLAGILFTITAGTLLHFCYEWSGENPFVALFAPVSESVWEHLKLLFFPVLVYTLFEIIVLFKASGRFLTARVAGVILGMFFILAAFFTYTGIIGKEFLAADILIFALSVLITFLASRFLEELKQMVSEIVHQVLSDNTNRRISAGASIVEEVEKGAKRRAARKKAAKPRPVFEGQPCPLCGKGTIVRGRTAYGCSEWRNGCTWRAPLDPPAGD